MIINSKKYNNMTQTELDAEFAFACVKNDFDLAKFLLSSPELKQHANIQTEENVAILTACSGGHFDFLKYLLSFPEFNITSDKESISEKFSPGFNWACSRKFQNIIHYFIFEMDIVKTKMINQFLTKNNMTEIDNLFKIREDNKTLRDDFSSTVIKNKNIQL